MPCLPARAGIEQLRRQAEDLLRAAKSGDVEALARVQSVSDRLTLSSAQSAVAREYGFAGWARLEADVDLRKVLNECDLDRLRARLAADPAAARADMERFCDHRKGVSPLGYMAMLRFDAGRLGLPRDVRGTGEMARVLLDAGAPVDGEPGDSETPLMTAASYGDAEVARVLVEAGADIEATAAPHAGGVPGGTALVHAAVFGMTDVVDVLVTAGARIASLEMAAAVGDVSAWPLDRATLQSRLRALIFAADHQRLAAIDQLLDAGTPIDAEDAEWGRQALRLAAENGRTASVAHLLARGADPGARDTIHARTALEWCRIARRDDDRPALRDVEAMLGVPACDP